MTTFTKTATTFALIAAALLSGCGKNPAASTLNAESRVSSTKKAGTTTTKAATTTKSTTTAATTTKKPGLATTTPGKTTTTAPTTTTTSPVTTGGTTVTAPPAVDQEGALRLTIRLWGTSPIGSLKLQVFAPGAEEGADIPLQLTGPEAVWEQEDLPAGTYTLHVFAYGPDGKAIGKGEIEALVKSSELRDLTLDVNTAKGYDIGVASTPDPEPTTTPSPTATATPAPTPTPAATATPSPAPTGPGAGGTLGLRVEIF